MKVSKLSVLLENLQPDHLYVVNIGAENEKEKSDPTTIDFRTGRLRFTSLEKVNNEVE